MPRLALNFRQATLMPVEPGQALAEASVAFAAQWCGFLVGDALFVHDFLGESVLEVRPAALPWLLRFDPGAGEQVSVMLRGVRPT